MASEKTFGQWLTERYIQWTGVRFQETGKRPSATEFARWLGFKQSTASSWMNGISTPRDHETVARLAAKLGPEVYAVLGAAPDDPDLQEIIAGWAFLPPDERRRLRALFDELRAAMDASRNARR